MCRIRLIELDKYGIKRIDQDLSILTYIDNLIAKYDFAYEYIYDQESNTLIIIEKTARAKISKRIKNILIDSIKSEIEDFLVITSANNNDINIDINIDNDNEINI